MIVLDSDDVQNLITSLDLKRTSLGLRAISKSGLPLCGGSAKDAMYFITTSCGDAGIVQGQYAVHAVWSSVEDVAYALTVGPFIFLSKEKKRKSTF
jgi:hypothetical protein